MVLCVRCGAYSHVFRPTRSVISSGCRVPSAPGVTVVREMGRRCTTCTHPDVDQINESLVGLVPVEEIARRRGLSASAVRRHRDAHLGPQMLAALEASESFGVEQLEKILVGTAGRALIMLDRAEPERICRSRDCCSETSARRCWRSRSLPATSRRRRCTSMRGRRRSRSWAR